MTKKKHNMVKARNPYATAANKRKAGPMRDKRLKCAKAKLRKLLAEDEE